MGRAARLRPEIASPPYRLRESPFHAAKHVVRLRSYVAFGALPIETRATRIRTSSAPLDGPCHAARNSPDRPVPVARGIGGSLVTARLPLTAVCFVALLAMGALAPVSVFI